MKGKEKCKALKEIRRQIAEKNDIPFAVSQCTHQGDCKGTCPKCESELRYLERELAIRQGLGKAVAIAGISIGACTAFTACSPMDTITDFLEGLGANSDNIDDDYSGGISMQEPDDTLAGNVVSFEWETAPDETMSEIQGDIAVPQSPNPDETMSAIEGDIAIEP